MRIGMLVDMYKPHISGITMHVSLTKRVLEKEGHKVFVFTFGDEDYEDDELYIVRSPGVPLNVMDTGFHLSFRYSRTAQRKLSTMDVVHVHHPFLSGQLALRYCRAYKLPLVFTNHTRQDLYAQHYVPYVPEALTLTFLQAYLYDLCRRCDAVIAPSPGALKMLRQLGLDMPIQVIPNGVELAPFQSPLRRLTRAALGLPEEALVLMYVGRLNPEKNLPFLLRAFFGVATVRPEVVLALVGDGADRDDLRDQVERSGLAHRVYFCGKAAYDQVPDYLALADVFVTASQTEVHPLSVIEAMAAGLPVLGMDSAGVSDTITDGVDGLISPPDLAAFTARLMRLVMEPETRQRLAARARETAQLYDINRTARMLLQVYEQATNHRVSLPRRDWTDSWKKLFSHRPWTLTSRRKMHGELKTNSA